MKYWYFILFLELIISCNSKGIPGDENPQEDLEIPLEVPGNFPNPVYNFTNNPITENGFQLGKAIFNDPILSRDNSISCAECHNQNAAFTHHGHDLSHGIDNKIGFRNSMSIVNTAWYTNFFWDGGVHDLDLFSIAPIENPVEMDENLENVLKKMQKTSKYPPMFKKAFGSDSITSANFLKALSQFMNSLVSSNSKYDQVKRNEGAVFSEQEKRGYDLFVQKCETCHREPLFTDNAFRNNGLPPNKLNDLGRFRITELEGDKYKFKTPTLRNIEFSAPYMHDGRFTNLEEVLNHYESGIADIPNIDTAIGNGISLSKQDKKDIISFLLTLTDKEYLTNPRFSF
ncbi:MAG: hypothetical protein RIR51_2041 [Bacteroidota bacterium]